jgi:hypothetical protein
LSAGRGHPHSDLQDRAISQAQSRRPQMLNRHRLFRSCGMVRPTQSNEMACSRPHPNGLNRTHCWRSKFGQIIHGH